ncbi:MAG TPA: pyruvate kinase, partial [Conexibacter sp.]|nr:pyruvate kinase [Conexibacter sp.]
MTFTVRKDPAELLGPLATPVVTRPARRTKIVATIGPATEDPRTVERLIAAGIDCARVNCSHASPAQLRAQAAAVRSAAQRAGRPVALLVDLQGPKLRTSPATAARTLAPGDEVTFAGVAPGEEAPAGAVGVGLPDFAALVSPDSEIVVGDGLPRLEVTSVEPPLVRARVTSPGPISANKGVFVTHARPLLPALTDKDRADLDVAIELEADFVALSFVRSAADVLLLRELLAHAGSRARVIAKIEKVEAFAQLDEILDAADAIMIARGDYGVEAGVEHVPPMQKEAIRRAAVHGKLTITATQMLESMIASPEPTRAEVADVANAVLDGTSA